MHLATMKQADVAALPRNMPVVLPLGAIEQHGPHLPVETDSLLCQEIVRRAEVTLHERVLVAPLQWLGSSHHHLGFPGVLSVSPGTYARLVSELVQTVVQQGFRRVLLLSGHGGNLIPGQQALAEVRQRHGERHDLLLLASTYWDLRQGPLAADIRQRTMGHACEWETSMMLRLAPDLVGNHRTAEPVPLDDPFAPAARAWVTRERSASGLIGDPRAANAEKGERLLRAFGADVTALLEKMLTWAGRW